MNKSLKNLSYPSLYRKFHFPRSAYLQIFITLLIILFTVIAFWQVQHNDFINLDDNLYITNNSHIKEGLTLKGIYWALTSTQNAQWSPVTFLSHMLDYKLFGPNAGGHHFTNLLFHIANTLLLFFLLRRMTGALWPSALAAVIFAVHPLHVESVAWIAERRDVLYAFFLLLTMWVYIKYVRNPMWFWHISILLCFVLAVMSKPMAVTLPFVLLLLDYWPLARLRIGKNAQKPIPFTAPWLANIKQNIPISHLFIEKASLFCIAAVIGLFTVFSAWGTTKSLSSLKVLPLIVRIENAAISYVQYILKMIWPNPLAVLYPYSMTLPFWKVICATLLLLTITILVIVAKRKHPYLMVGWLWFLITLLPVIGLIQAGIQSMADRFMYMPMIGLLIMVIYGISDICRKWSYKILPLTVLSVSLLAILMASTKAQVKLWRNSETLFRHTLQVTNNNYFIHNYLGAALAAQGKDQEALIHFKRSLEINPFYADAYCNIGTLLLNQGKYREAIPSFLAALKNNPQAVEALTNLGIILTKYGKIKEAIEYFSEAIRINPDYEEAYFNQGNLLLQMKKYEEAIQYYQRALTINSKNSKTHNNLGVALLGLGNPGRALDCYRKALQINPDDADAHYNLGSLYIQQGKYEQAILQLTEALRIKPNDGEIHFTVGMLHLKIGRKELALKQYAALRNIDNKTADTLYRNISQYKN